MLYHKLVYQAPVWCPENGALRRAHYGYTIFYAISFKNFSAKMK